ncbi:hypothetical protein V8E36_003788 [Tilletia maclaganii]
MSWRIAFKPHLISLSGAAQLGNDYATIMWRRSIRETPDPLPHSTADPARSRRWNDITTLQALAIPWPSDPASGDYAHLGRKAMTSRDSRSLRPTKTGHSEITSSGSAASPEANFMASANRPGMDAMIGPGVVSAWADEVSATARPRIYLWRTAVLGTMADYRQCELRRDGSVRTTAVLDVPPQEFTEVAKQIYSVLDGKLQACSSLDKGNLTATRQHAAFHTHLPGLSEAGIAGNPT